MSRYCENCGKELQGDMPCPLCNPIVIPKDSNAKPAYSSERTADCNPTPFPMQERIRPGIVWEIFGTAFFSAIMLSQVIREFQMYLKWGDDLFGLVLSCVLLVVLVSAAVIGFLHRKERVYLITCPACGQKTIYPVGAEGVNCSACQKRLVMSGNQIKKID